MKMRPSTPMGTGPYTLVEYKSDLHTILEAKPDYWNAERIWGGDGTPRWQRYEMNVIPEASTRLAALEAGDVDIAHTIPLDQARSLPGPDAAGEPVRAIVGPTGATMFMYIPAATAYTRTEGTTGKAGTEPPRSTGIPSTSNSSWVLPIARPLGWFQFIPS